jgi:hypothetical protein
MLLSILCLLIDVTFSTPTPVYDNYGWIEAVTVGKQKRQGQRAHPERSPNRGFPWS